MKLDRNINGTGKGKYALIKLREIPGNPSSPLQLARAIAENPKSIDWGVADSDSEFFVIRLKDRHAFSALLAYSQEAKKVGDEEWAAEVLEMACRAYRHPNKKTPD